MNSFDLMDTSVTDIYILDSIPSILNEGLACNNILLYPNPAYQDVLFLNSPCSREYFRVLPRPQPRSQNTRPLVLDRFDRKMRGLMTLASRNEGGVDDWFLEDVVSLCISERLDSVHHVSHVELLVRFVNKSVSPDSVAFVYP